MQGVLPRLEVDDQIVMHKDPQCARRHFDELVQANPDLRIELQEDGRILVMAPAGGESDYESIEVAAQLHFWAKANGNGKAFGATLGCNLPDGSTLSPDAAWIANERLDALSKEVKQHYLPLAPDFIVEVKSPSNSERELRTKCRQWIANGTRLAWLINSEKQRVWEYFGTGEELFEGPESLIGKRPVEGFALDLRPIWQGL